MRIYFDLVLSRTKTKTKVEGFAVKIRTIFKFITWVLGFFLALIVVFIITEKWEDKDIAGRWLIRFDIKKGSVNDYIGESHTFDTFFIQNEAGIIGDGEKKEYNGDPLLSHEHSKLEYQGIIDGSKLIAIYELHDEKKVSFGNIIVDISHDGRQMTGIFTGPSTGTEGTVIGERVD